MRKANIGLAHCMPLAYNTGNPNARHDTMAKVYTLRDSRRQQDAAEARDIARGQKEAAKQAQWLLNFELKRARNMHRSCIELGLADSAALYEAEAAALMAKGAR